MEDRSRRLKKRRFSVIIHFTMTFDVITIFPKILDSYVKESIIGRAQKGKKIKINFHDLRKWTTDKRRSVDDVPFGGGAGMVLKPAPIYKALKELKALKGARKTTRTILLSAGGAPFTQAKARELSHYTRVVFVCGRYEGVDHRVAEYMVDEELSIGPYVLTGGELPAMVVIDAVSRLIPRVLGNKESLTEESFGCITGSSHEVWGAQATRECISREATEAMCAKPRREYPHYTRPAVFSPTRGIKWHVPEVLLSGDHKKIREWRKKRTRDISLSFNGKVFGVDSAS